MAWTMIISTKFGAHGIDFGTENEAKAALVRAQAALTSGPQDDPVSIEEQFVARRGDIQSITIQPSISSFGI